jgi:hypothetical protein
MTCNISVRPLRPRYAVLLNLTHIELSEMPASDSQQESEDITLLAFGNLLEVCEGPHSVVNSMQAIDDGAVAGSRLKVGELREIERFKADVIPDGA